MDKYLEARVKRLEKLVKRRMNEDMQMLPNGAPIGKVKDILLAWTDADNFEGAVRIMRSRGLLKRSTNKWYPTEADVIDAIDACWEDNAGSTNEVAKFFMGNFDGVYKCTLNLFPSTGRPSRAKSLTLKFDWEDLDDLEDIYEDDEWDD